MRYGLLALSIAMLTTGGVAAQSALAISNSAKPASTTKLDSADERSGSAYGALPFTLARSYPGR